MTHNEVLKAQVQLSNTRVRLVEIHNGMRIAMIQQMNESMLRVARSGWYPRIYLFGNYYYQRPHQRYLPLRDEFNDSWDIGITFSFDILNWGAVSHWTSQAQAQLRQTEHGLDKRRDDIAVEVTQYSLEVVSASEQADAAQIAMEYAGWLP